MAPETLQRTPLEKDRGPNTGAIVDGKALNVEDSTCCAHEHCLVFSTPMGNPRPNALLLESGIFANVTPLLDGERTKKSVLHSAAEKRTPFQRTLSIVI
jgi:hypothetical protein